MAIPASLLDELEQAHSAGDARKVLAPFKGADGLSRAFFERVATHFTSDPSRAFALASRWKAVLQFGDDASYAYRAKGVADRGRCDWRASANSFIKAGELARSPEERFSFQAGAVDALAHAGLMGDAEQLAESLTKGLVKLKRADLAARIYLNLGNVLLLQDRMVEARKALEKALVSFEAQGMKAEAASTLLGLSTTHLYSGHTKLAHELAEKAKVLADASGHGFVGLLAEMNVAHSSLLAGRPDEALDKFVALREPLSLSPADRTRCVEFAGDAYFELNLWTEALDAYKEALSDTNFIQPNHAANVRLGMGRCLVASGRPSEAIPLFMSAQKRYARLGNLAWESAALLGRSRAYREMGKLHLSRSSAVLAAEMAKTANSAYHWCDATLENEDASEGDLRRVRRTAEGYGYVGLLWRIHHLHARRTERSKKGRRYRLMVEAILDSRLMTTSLISRSSFLRDKSAALREYLAYLLDQPTKRNVDEAMRVILETRSVTLIDEILAASAVPLSESVVEALEKVRMDLQNMASESKGPTGSRTTAPMSSFSTSAQRHWTELTRNARAVTHEISHKPAAGVAVMTQAGGQFYVMSEGACARLGCDETQLAKAIRWLEFDLLAPMVDPGANPANALRALANLREDVVCPWREKFDDVSAICPDGILWRVPWQCLFSDGLPPSLVLHPSSSRTETTFNPADVKSLLWVSGAADLVHAEGEAERFLSKYPNSTVCRTLKEAQESFNGSYDILHVVAHARHRAENPMFSAIEFGDGLLFGADVARSSIRPKLVTLSACHTGEVSLISRDEPDGLARAFIARGASHVVASGWAIHDEAAARAFGMFYECLESNTTVRAALDSARKQVRLWRDHPYYWGALTLYDGYSTLM